MFDVVGNRVIATDMDHGERKYGSIIIQNDDGKRHGIRSRWCKVFKVGEEVDTIKPEQWILVEHGRWSHKFVETDDEGNERDFWVVDYPKGVLAVSDEKPETWNIGNE